jgi:uncharacterized protein (DUF2384 family)
MSDPAWRITCVENEARALYGAKAASTWMGRPNRHLARLTPCELAEAGEAGMRVVLAVLRQYPRFKDRASDS